MIIDDNGCLCERCLRSGYCQIQKRIGRVQEVLYAIPPDTTTVKFIVKRCSKFEEKVE